MMHSVGIPGVFYDDVREEWTKDGKVEGRMSPVMAMILVRHVRRCLASVDEAAGEAAGAAPPPKAEPS